MLTKIIIKDKAYEVDLLQGHEVVADIKTRFMGSDTVSELKTQEDLNKVINQYVDNYEKVEYKEKDYFILKSRIPVEFKQKSYTKKYINSDSMTARFFGALGLPVMFIATNVFDIICNFKNMFNSAFGSTKINASFTYSEITFLSMGVILLNIGFWFFMIESIQQNTIPLYSIFIVQAINMVLGFFKPFKYHYNQIENYQLAPYSFDSKYDHISSSPLERLHSMKKDKSKTKIDFDFAEDNQQVKVKEKNYASY